MDHLVIPKGKKHVEIPYIGKKVFEGTFEDYPKSQKWSHHELNIDPDFGKKPPHEVAAFLQNWLFFGVLTETFKSGDIEWDVNDFIVKKASRKGQEAKEVVSTASLPGILEKWHQQIIATNKANTRPQYLTLVLAHQFATQRFEKFEDYIEKSRVEVPEWPVISMSIALLGWTLETALPRVYKTAPENWPSGRWEWEKLIRARMVEAGWTIADWVKDGIIKLDGWYYLGYLESPRKHQHCQNCTDPKCIKKFLTENSYVVKHAEKCKGDCEDINVSNEVLEIVRNGKTPLVCWEDGKMTVSGSDLTDCYVAISHVWSDGMGNPKENALPICQLAKIQSLVNRLYSVKRRDQKRTHMLFGPTNTLGHRDSSRKPVGFWMDTFCVPVKDDNVRKLAIQKMRDIYQFSDRTLVLDSWLRALYRDSDLVGRVTKLYLSNWQNRLWTLQEGVLAHNLYIQFKDGPQTLENLENESRKERESRLELKFYSSLVNTTVVIPLFGLKMETPIKMPVSDLLFSLIAGVVSRTTTRQSDETICLATMLNMDPSPLLNLPGKKKSGMSDEEKRAWEVKTCEKRMEYFLQFVGKFDLKLIFSNLPRLKSDGWGWAPRSFLNHPGLILGSSTNPNEGERLAVVKTDGEGLLVTCPGFMLASVPADLGHSIIVRKDKDFHATLTVQAPNAQPPHTWSTDPEVQYVVLSYVPVRTEEPAEKSEGILGILKGEDEHGRKRVRYVRRVKLEWILGFRIEIENLTLEEPDEKQTVMGQWEKDDTEWCLL